MHKKTDYVPFMRLQLLLLYLISISLSPLSLSNPIHLDSQNQSVWEIDLSNNFNTLKLEGTLSSPTSHHRIPVFYLEFFDKKGQRLMRMKIHDEACIGEYHSQLSFQPASGQKRFHYFEDTFPWPENFWITLKKLKQKHYSIHINAESHTLELREKPRKVTLSIYDGQIQITQLSLNP